jgi:hypothetical protein
MKGESLLVGRAEQVAEAGLPLESQGSGATMPTYARDDYVKVEFQDENTVISVTCSPEISPLEM